MKDFLDCQLDDRYHMEKVVKAYRRQANDLNEKYMVMQIYDNENYDHIFGPFCRNPREITEKDAEPLKLQSSVQYSIRSTCCQHNE